MNRITIQAGKSVSWERHVFIKREAECANNKGRLVHLEKIKETKETGSCYLLNQPSFKGFQGRGDKVRK